jgi:hypothetical protein
MTFRMLRAAAMSLAVITIMAAAACGSSTGSSSSQLTPTDVNRYVLAKEATASLTRLIDLISAADQTVQQLSHQRPGSVAYGSRLGWNSVAISLNNFTQAQAVAVPQLTDTVGQHKLLGTTWLKALDSLDRRTPRTRRALLEALAAPQKEELKDRPLLRNAAAALAELTCSLELKHHELATAADTALACGTARQLSSPPAS